MFNESEATHVQFSGTSLVETADGSLESARKEANIPGLDGS